MTKAQLREPAEEIFRTPTAVGVWVGGVFALTLSGVLDVERSTDNLDQFEAFVKTRGHRVPLLVDVRAVTAMPREARVLVTERCAPLVTREAIIVGSAITRMLANVMGSFHRPLHPRRVFNDEAEAWAWIRGSGAS